MADHQDNELNVQSSEIHHRTDIVYPELVSDYMAWNDTFIPIAANASNRYYPGHLVRRPRVAAHTNRFTEGETAMYTVTRATANAARIILWEHSDDELGYADLAMHMRRLQQLSGRTRLSVGTVHEDGAPWARGGDETKPLTGVHTDRSTRNFNIRVRRSTVLFLKEQNALPVEDEVYEFHVDELRQLGSEAEPRANAPSWARLILQAVFRTTDLAVRHVDTHLEQLGLAFLGTLTPEQYNDYDHDLLDKPLGNDSTWKARRVQNVAEPLNAMVTRVDPSTLVGTDSECLVCFEDIESGDAKDPVHPPCHSTHLTCFECLTKWADKQTAQMAACPSCNRPLFNEQQKIEIAYGLKNGIFHNDARYTPWENFEISCADLDERLAKEYYAPDPRGFIHPNLIFHAIQLQVQGAQLEDEASTPRHLQIVHSQDFKLALRSIEGLLADMGVRRAHFSCLFKELYEGAEEALHLAMMRRYMHRVGLVPAPGIPGVSMEVDSLEHMSDRFLRPGFQEFLARILSRALEFVRLRHCQCGAAGMHKHGDRFYYDMKMLAAPTADLLEPLPYHEVYQLYDTDSWCGPKED